MMKLPVLFSFFFIFLLILILAPIRININYLRENKKETLKIKFILIWGLVKFPMPSFNRWKRRKKTEKTARLENSGKSLKSALLFGKAMKKTVICDKFRWKTAFGLSDAAQTGVLSGMIWSIKGNILAFLKRYLIFTDQEPDIEVIPDFKKAYLVMEAAGTFTIYPYRLLKAVFKVVYFKVRGGGFNWKIIQSRA